MARALVLLLPGLLIGCGPSAGPADDSSGIETLDWDNRTSSGFHRWVYPVDDCGTQIPLQPPFEVSEDGFGSPDIESRWRGSTIRRCGRPARAGRATGPGL